MTGAVGTAPLRGELRTISVVGYAHGTSHFFHLLFPPLFPWLMAQFDLNFTQVGALMTVFFVISGVGQALAGFVVDRIGPRRVLLGGLGLLALSALALAAAQNYAMLALAAALAGAGNSVFHPADFTILNRRVSQPRLGHAFSVHGLSGNLGWAAAPVFLAGLAAALGWRYAAAAAALVGLVALALVLAQREALSVEYKADAVAGASGAAAVSQFAFLATAPVWMCFGFFLVITMAAGALNNYSPMAFGEMYGLSLASATTALSAYLLGGAVGIVAGGFVAARTSEHDRVILPALGVAAALAALLASGALAPAWVLPVMVCMGVGTGIAGPSRDLLVRKAATSSHGQAAYGRVYGFVYSGLDVGLACAPLAFGPLMDAGRFAAVLGGVALLQVLAIASAASVGARTRTGVRTEQTQG